MNNLKLLFFISFLAATIISCNKDKEGTLEVEFTAKMNNQPLEILKEYPIQGGMADIEMLQFYITNLAIEDKDGVEKIIVKDVDLIDFKTNNTILRKQLPEGSYKNLALGLGLDEFWGDSDPSTFEDTHPLSLFQNNFWLMSDSYIFVRIEGNFTKNGEKKSILYHLGDSSFYTEIIEEKAFSIFDGNTTTKRIQFDLDAFFANIDLETQENTHTTGNFPVAEELMNKFAASFSII